MSFLIIFLLSIAPLLIIQCTKKGRTRKVISEQNKMSRRSREGLKVSRMGWMTADKRDKKKKKKKEKETGSLQKVLEPPSIIPGKELDPTQSHEVITFLIT